MNTDDWYMLFLIVFAIGLLILVPLEINNEVYAAEDAVNQCIERGYENYMDFKRPFLSSEAKAVRCEYPTNNLNINVELR